MTPERTNTPTFKGFDGRGKSLCVVISVSPSMPQHEIARNLVVAALGRGVLVWVYLLDEAVRGLVNGEWNQVIQQGGRLLACSEGLRRHGVVAVDDTVNRVGLSMLGEVMSKADRTLGFHGNGK